MDLKELINAKVKSKTMHDGTIIGFKDNNKIVIYNFDEKRRMVICFPIINDYLKFTDIYDIEELTIQTKIKKLEKDFERNKREIKNAISAASKIENDAFYKSICDEYNPKGTSIVMPKYTNNSFIKYEGQINNGDAVLAISSVVDSKGKERHILNFTNISKRIEAGTPFYLCKCFDGKPRIFGRGISEGYSDVNIVHKDWIMKHNWMSERNRYVFVREVEFLNTELKNCPATEDLFESIGGNLFYSKQGRECGLDEFQKAHNQHSHLFISEDGYEGLERIYEHCANRYGTLKFNS